MTTATLTRKARTPKPAKQANIQDRTDFGNGYVLYTCLSSNGVDKHWTTVVNGHATGCTCRERDGYTIRYACYHMTGCEKNEQERSTDQHIHVQDDLHSCYGCGYLLKAEGYCHKCLM